MNVTFPCAALNTVLFLPREVLFQVVDDQCAVQWTAKPRQVFYEGSIYLRRVLPVESMLDQGPILVELVKNEISVSLVSSRENYNLVQFCHVSQESNAERPNLVNHAPMLKVYKSFIEVEYERVLAILGVISGEGWR